MSSRRPAQPGNPRRGQAAVGTGPLAHTHLETLQPQPQAEIKATGISLGGLPWARTPQDPAAPLSLCSKHLLGLSATGAKLGAGGLGSSPMTRLTPHGGHGVSPVLSAPGAKAQV